MFYKLVAGEDFFELNPGVRIVPIFKDLTSMQMTYICLVCDPSHDNPVRTLQGKKKLEKAAVLAGYKLEPDGKRLAKQGREIIAGQNRSIENGIVEFKKLHYDEKTDTYESLVNQIGEIRDFMKTKKNNDPKLMKQALDLGVKLPDLIEAKQKVEQLLQVETTIRPQLDDTFTAADLILPEDKTSEEESSSIIDQFMKNKRT